MIVIARTTMKHSPPTTSAWYRARLRASFAIVSSPMSGTSGASNEDCEDADKGRDAARRRAPDACLHLEGSYVDPHAHYLGSQLGDCLVDLVEPVDDHAVVGVLRLGHVTVSQRRPSGRGGRRRS